MKIKKNFAIFVFLVDGQGSKGMGVCGSGGCICWFLIFVNKYVLKTFLFFLSLNPIKEGNFLSQ